MTISQIFTTPPTDRREPAEQNCFELLEKLHIPFERVEHDPAFTMEDCREISEALYVQVCKNLFLCNRQQTQFYLLCMPASKTFKTKDLSGQLDVSRLSFAPAEKMQELLGVTPGSASILALMNDTEHHPLQQGVHRLPPLYEHRNVKDGDLGCTEHLPPTLQAQGQDGGFTGLSGTRRGDRLI